MYSDMIFENYNAFINGHEDEIGTVEGGLEMLTSDGMFRGYISSLTEGLDQSRADTIMNVCQRQREMLLEESVQLGPSSTIVAYAVSYFPILTDIYSEPVLSQASVVHPVNKGVVTLPKAEITGTVTNSAGTTSTYYLPRNTSLVRQAVESITVSADTATNLFSSSSSSATISATTHRVNRRYLLLYSVTVTDTDLDDGSATHDSTTVVNFRPDARGQIYGNFTFTDSDATAANTVTCTIVGNVDWDTGVVRVSGTFANGGTNMTYAIKASGLTFKTVFSPKTGDIGRVKVALKISGWDVDIDVRDDFEIELQQEQIQDYRDIYNIDLIRTMSEAIKTQIMLNKDFDIAYLLESAETAMDTNGAYKAVTLENFGAMGNSAHDYNPRSIIDLLKNVVPFINSVSRVVYRNFRGYPQYLLCGNQTASMLESMQEVVADLRDVKKGQLGFGTPHVNFAKQTIIPCQAIDDGKIYVVFKPEANNLSKAVLIDLVYKPIYIIEEITNSQKRTYVKSRSAVELVNDYAVGLVSFTDLSTFIGP
jgi:hypothetical protein